MTMGTLALAKILSSVPTLGIAFSSAKHLDEFGKPFPKIKIESEEGILLNQGIRGEIEFKNVDFGYWDDDSEV